MRTELHDRSMWGTPSPAPRRSQRRVAGAAAILAVLAALVPLVAVAPSAAATGAIRATSSTVWLCRPGQAADPCAFGSAATAVAANGDTSIPVPVTAPRAKAFDCFYVYPTSSPEQSNNSNLTVQPAETVVAQAQASQFSQVCNVWAPMYRQATLKALQTGAAIQPSVIATAYGSLLSAWRDYLAHDNHGRPVIFIGHSQGAAMLIKLLEAQVDPTPSVRKRMVSAIILGGNVQVPIGRTVGGSFRHIPTCAKASETGCVIAYSSFGTPPPSTSLFGRPGQGVSLQSGQTQRTGQQVACVNPATFSSKAGSLQPYFVSGPTPVRHVTITTSWVTYPDLYTAQCEYSGGASWLQVDTTGLSGDPRPTVSATLGPNWGYHIDDVNLALGNLVADVATEEAAYR